MKTDESMAIDKVIGLKVRRARTEKNMSQEKLGDALGLTFQQVQKYEKGVNRVSTSTLLKICRVLDKPFDFFINIQISTPAQSDYDTLLGLPDGRDLVGVAVKLSRPKLKTLLNVAKSMGAGGGEPRLDHVNTRTR